jgi:hypothetical protein
VTVIGVTSFHRSRAGKGFSHVPAGLPGGTLMIY